MLSKEGMKMHKLLYTLFFLSASVLLAIEPHNCIDIKQGKEWKWEKKEKNYFINI